MADKSERFWNYEGNRVRHVLSGWVGTVIKGYNAEVMDTSDRFSEAEIRFWTGDSFEVLRCVHSEVVPSNEPIY